MNGNRGLPALFLDRDGVLIEDPGYLHQVDQIQILPGVRETLADIAGLGVPLVVVTNQSGVARGYFSERDVDSVHRWLGRHFEAAGAHLSFYYCAEHPSAGRDKYRTATNRRKPGPGMLIEAARDKHLDLSRSIIVGDKVSDIQAGVAAGCRTLLVRTGCGAATEHESEPIWDVVFDSLSTSREYLVDYFRKALRADEMQTG